MLHPRPHALYRRRRVHAAHGSVTCPPHPEPQATDPPPSTLNPRPLAHLPAVVRTTLLPHLQAAAAHAYVHAVTVHRHVPCTVVTVWMHSKGGTGGPTITYYGTVIRAGIAGAGWWW